jgi:hypothetical protein
MSRGMHCVCTPRPARSPASAWAGPPALVKRAVVEVVEADQIVERNLGVVDEHVHNENPVDIDKAIALYAPEVVWELPARGVLCIDKEQVKQAYLKMFQGYGLPSTRYMRPSRRPTRSWASSRTASCSSRCSPACRSATDRSCSCASSTE